ncbi:hypothetical protein [Nocardia aurantiaca]|uniref:Uncharacterized protein n=1 Tax=Nocardia aurantiaca TaxID=2675850 RepID=A0A6I3L244_9NOCA|nr:hypothetical protein [Nocardia aurantiaca]MTE17083.1 hypothetical protein [Nocardia aurantiaca]
MTRPTADFEIHVCTVGFSLHPDIELFDDSLWRHQVRFSTHSPDMDTCDRINGIRFVQHANERVAWNQNALSMPETGKPTVGIGMVIQPGNYDQLTEMAKFAESVRPTRRAMGSNLAEGGRTRTLPSR